jgi:ribosomal protein S18 acetylase RimI-like enzyme
VLSSGRAPTPPGVTTRRAHRVDRPRPTWYIERLDPLACRSPTRKSVPVWHIRELRQHEIERVGAVLGLARLGQGDGYYLVAWEDGEPLGHAHLALTDPPELQDVSVRPEHRRRGVATALAFAAEQAVIARGCARIRLSVSVDNEAAQILYRHLGYGDIGLPPRRVHGPIQIRTGTIQVDDTLLTWEKSLDGSLDQHSEDREDHDREP